MNHQIILIALSFNESGEPTWLNCPWLIDLDKKSALEILIKQNNHLKMYKNIKTFQSNPWEFLIFCSLSYVIQYTEHTCKQAQI